MTYIQSLIAALSGPIRFSGRSERAEIWSLVLLGFVSWLALIGTNIAPAKDALLARDLDPIFEAAAAYFTFSGTVLETCMNSFILLYFGYLALCLMALEVRRLHDLSMTGFWVWVPVLAYLIGQSLVMLLTGQVPFLAFIDVLSFTDADPLIMVLSSGTFSIAFSTRFFVVWSTLFRAGTAGDNDYGAPA